jgi:ferredoxin
LEDPLAVSFALTRFSLTLLPASRDQGKFYRGRKVSAINFRAYPLQNIFKQAMDRVCIIYCSCGAGIFSGIESDKLADALHDFDTEVFELHDLCALSIHEKEQLSSIGKEYDHKIVIACYPRTIKYLFKQNNIDFGRYEVLNFRGMQAEQMIEALAQRFEQAAGKASHRILVSQLKVPPWYPVIDDERCTLCGQCARFCLFGVYKFDKKHLSVINPLACKNNCPACGRICPEAALIFPRLPESSVLSGAEPGGNKAPGDHLDNGLLYEKLKERNRIRNSIFKKDILQKAEEERNKALEELKNKQ